MSDPLPLPIREKSREDDLLAAHHKLREHTELLRRESVGLAKKLIGIRREFFADREFRLASLNLLEDAAMAQEAEVWESGERQRAEAELRQSEKLLSLSLQAGRMGTFQWESANQALTFSDISLEVFGVTPGQKISTGEEVSQLIHPADRERRQRLFAHAAKNGTDYHTEFRIVRPRDGEIAWIEERGHGSRHPVTGAIRIFGVHWNITARKLAEEASLANEEWLAAQKEAFQAAINNAPLDVSLNVLIRTALKQAGDGARCAFYIANNSGTELFHIIGMPLTYAKCVDGFKIGPDSIACGLAVATARPVITADVMESPQWQPWRWLAEKHEIRACWSFPIEKTDGKVVGTFALYFKTPREATPRDYESAAVLTRAAAIIISRTQEAEERARMEQALLAVHEQLETRVRERTIELYASNQMLLAEIAGRKKAEAARKKLLGQLNMAEESERRRISRELHDQIGQHLAALTMSFKAAESSKGPPAAALREARAIADKVGHEIHDLALELRPTALDDLGLARALSNYVEEWEQKTKIRAGFHCAGFRRRLPAAMETAIYRMVQEALTNVLKHAQAENVSVLLERKKQIVSLIVEDDGRGFDPAANQNEKREQQLGLLGMRERAGLLDGELTVESQPGRGTAIFARLPLPKREKKS